MIALVLAAALVPVEGPGFVLDLRYASKDNFLQRDVYGPAGLDTCWARPELAAALRRAGEELGKKGLRLVLWDCWRPIAVQREMWKLAPDRRYVADPAKGSHHNRGAAVDASLAGMDGRLLELPTAFDEFSPRAASAWRCPAAEEDKCRRRDELRAAMRAAGLTGIASEWWHFQLRDARKLPIIERP